MKASLVCLLLLLTPLDDALLMRAAEAEDEAWATQNNEFVADARPVQGERPARAPARPDTPPTFGTAPGLPVPPSGRFARTGLSLLPGTVPLYLFMSLQW